MHTQNSSNKYSLSMRDLAIMTGAGIGINEMTSLSLKHPGLPPIWSRIPYLMIMHPDGTSTNHFWKYYRLFDELLKTRDSHYKQAYIPKASGGTRELLIPDWEIRHHQKYILKDILYKIPVSKHACAYHKHRGLADLAQPHVGHKVLIHLDIKDFFNSITEQMVFEALLKETNYPKTVAGFLSRLCCYKRHLPQGACTSPALSNICFKECDSWLASLAKRNNLAYTRYSDDLYFSGDDVDAAAIIKEVRTILSQRGFTLHNSKTKVIGQHQAQMVTAIVVNDKMQVPREYRRKLRQEIYYLKRFKEDARDVWKADSYQDYLYQLMGKISFVLYVDPKNKEFLEAKDLIDRILYKLEYERMPF